MASFRHLRSILLLFLATLGGSVAWADPVYIDVRTVEEYSADHIEGDLNLPLAELDTEALAARFGKDAELVLYCRSGARAGQALQQLVTAGFTNVSNGGGISDVRQLRAIGSAVTPGSDASTTPAQ
jgi:phage shock protein E